MPLKAREKSIETLLKGRLSKGHYTTFSMPMPSTGFSKAFERLLNGLYNAF
jgi:hypothetical protein